MHRARRIGWMAAAACACVAWWGPAAPGQTIVLQPSSGIYESVAYDTTQGFSFSRHDGFLTHSWFAGGDAFKESGLIQFDLSSIPAGHVLSAELVLFHAENAVPADTIFNIYQNTSAWSSSTVTWSSLPSFQAAPLSSISLTGDPGNSYSFDVTGAVNSWLGGTAPNDGFTIQARTGSTRSPPSTPGRPATRRPTSPRWC